MSENLLLVSTDARGVATVTLNRPDALNALNMALKADLAQAVRELSADAEIRSVVLTGAGRAFCSGGDIAEMALNDTPVRSRRRLADLLRDLVVPLAELEKPTIAAVNGHAHGAGLSLALACDIMVVSSAATLSCAFSKMGLIPDCGALYFLPRRLPMPMVKDLVYTGRRIDAAEAQRIGLAHSVVEPDQLLGVAQELAATFASSATVALGLAKRLLDQSLQSTLAEMSTLEAMAQAILYATVDHEAARTAFAAKAKPTFVGE